MDIKNIFRDTVLNNTEIGVLQYIQANPEKCIQEGIRSVAERCYSNPSTLVRLAKKLKFNGWLEMVYFIKFNITLPKLDVTNDVNFMNIRPQEKLESLLQKLAKERVLIHGSGFSQLIAQYIYNKFLVTGVNASLALWPDYEILEQKNANKFDSVWIISKSGRSSSALSWVKALEQKTSILSALLAITRVRWHRPPISHLLSTTRKNMMMISTGQIHSLAIVFWGLSIFSNCGLTKDKQGPHRVPCFFFISSFGTVPPVNRLPLISQPMTMNPLAGAPLTL